MMAGMLIYSQPVFRVTAPRAAVVIPAAAVPPLPLDRVERFLELSKRSPGLSRRARRRRRGERSAILRDLEKLA